MVNAFEIHVDGVVEAVIRPGETVSVGRSEDNDVVIEHPRVSAFHASFAAIDDQVVVTDLRSRNGIFVAGARVDASWGLHPGDRVVLAERVPVAIEGVTVPARPREELTTQCTASGRPFRIYSTLFPGPAATVYGPGDVVQLRLRGRSADLIYNLQQARGRRPEGCPPGVGWISVYELRRAIWGKVRPTSNRFNQLLFNTRARLRKAGLPELIERETGGDLWNKEDGGWVRLIA